MRKDSTNINRRSFIGRTGTVAAGLAFLWQPLVPARGKKPSGPANNEIRIFPSPDDQIRQTGWWEKEPLRIVELEEGYESVEKMELLRDLGANMEHVTRFTGTSPGTSFLDAHNLFGGVKIDFDTLEDYLNEAHKRGIKVIIYYNVHAIEISYARRHPEWQQLRQDGKPIEDVYLVDSSFCINSTWRDEVFQTIKRIAAFEIDGIFYDGPIFFAGTCYCESCKKLFREKYLSDLPSKAELSVRREAAGWKEILEFQSDSIVRFLQDSNEILKGINPQILLYMNGNTLGPSWPTGRDNRKIINETDILGAEGGFLYGELAEPVYKPGAAAKLLETQSGGKPTVVFDAAKQGPWAFSILPPGEISILYGQTITHQANVWLAIGATPALHKEEMDVIRRYNRFIGNNPSPFFKTESMARIALVWPQQSGNYYSGSSVPLTDFTKEVKSVKAGNIGEEFYGFYDGLARNHFPFDVLDEASIGDRADRYDLIILPNTGCLGSGTADQLRDFLKDGGNLISSFETSLYDEYGRKLDDFRLKDVFGLEKSGDIFGPLNWDYITTGKTDHASLKDITQRYLSAPTYGLKMISKAEIPLFFCKPLPGSYAGSPEISEFPFMVENTFGKGRSIYFAGTFGGSLYRFHFPEYYRILFNIVSGLSQPVIRMANTPSSVEVSIRRKGSSIFLYLINFTSEMKRPVQRIIPCAALKASVFIREEVKSVKSLWSGKSLKFSREGNSVSFVLPVLEEYDVIELSL